MDMSGVQGGAEVIRVISRHIEAGHEKEYDDWLMRFLELHRKAPGYLGTTIIAPGVGASNARYIIHRFRDEASMEAWEKSEQHQRMVDEANKYSSPHYEKATGLETWFALPNLKAIIPPPRWKMALVTYPGAYLLSMIAVLLLSSNPVTGTWPLLISNALVSGIIVLGLTYLVLPTLARALRSWLYPVERTWARDL